MSKFRSLHSFLAYGGIQFAFWTIVVALLAGYSIYSNHLDTIRIAENEARNYFNLNLFYRAWSARMGGVYVPAGKVAPNPYLAVPHRDVTTDDGQSLTLVNPAYMTRMVFEEIQKSSKEPIVSRLISNKPLNPLNVADAWEKESLEQFDGGKLVERSEVTTINGKPYLRLISRFLTESACLKCHAHQGYKEGDVRGGVTISIPLTTPLQAEKREHVIVVGSYLMLWSIGTSGIAVMSRRRQRYEEELKENEQKFRTVCDWTQDWEYWADSAGEMKYVSPSCVTITGYTPEEFTTDRDLILRIVHPADREPVEQHHCLTLRHEPSEDHQIEFRIITRSGETRWIHHACRQVISGTEYLGRRVSNRDITAFKSAVQSRQDMERKLMQTQKLESLGVLAGGIAHDFNNILTAIVGNADMALMRITPESPVFNNLQKIESAASRATDLARQMLAYSGKGKFVIVDIDLNGLLEEMIHMLEVSISKKTEISFNFSRPLPLVEADATQIRQVVMNLIINASEAIGDEKGVISVVTGCMNCDTGYLKANSLDEIMSEGEYVYLEVTDTGCGMNMEIQQKIFDPFFTTKFTGRGLGMAAVQGIVKGHRGGIIICSEQNRGSTFKVMLPSTGKSADICTK